MPQAQNYGAIIRFKFIKADFERTCPVSLRKKILLFEDLQHKRDFSNAECHDAETMTTCLRFVPDDVGINHICVLMVVFDHGIHFFLTRSPS